MKHTIIAYLLACLVFSAPIGILMGGVAGVDLPVEAGRGHFTAEQADTMVIELLLIGLGVAFGLTVALGALPWAYALRVAARHRAHGAWFYVVAGSLAPMPVVAIWLFYHLDPLGLLAYRTFQLGGLFSLAGVAMLVFGLLGALAGRAYWGYARRFEPILGW